MNIKKFRTISNITSKLLKLFSIVSIVVVGWLFIGKITEPNNVVFDYEDAGFIFFTAAKNFQKDVNGELAALILSPVLMVMFVYMLWSGSKLFDYLTSGYNPFTHRFVQNVKRLSLIMMISDVLFPILYSIVLSLTIKNGYFVQFSLSGTFFIGLILYIVSEIFNYGIELQKLSDNTV